jgi:alpha-L-arabinofuranosidase
LVNPAGQAVAVEMILNGGRTFERTVWTTTLAGAANDENTIEQPHKTVPKDSVLEGIGKVFSVSLAPYSVTALRLKQTGV